MHRQSCTDTTIATYTLNEFHWLISKLLQWLSARYKLYLLSIPSAIRYNFNFVAYLSALVALDPVSLQKLARIDWKGIIEISLLKHEWYGIAALTNRAVLINTHGILSRCPYIFRNRFVTVIWMHAVCHDCLPYTYSVIWFKKT